MLSVTDLKFSDEGDFVIGEDGDFSLSSGEECLRESVSVRIKTDIGEWGVFPRLGANLSTLIGRKNNRNSLDIGIFNIRSSLVYDNFIPFGSLSITGLPAGNVIMFIVKIRASDRLDFSIAVRVNLESGIEVI